MADKSKTNDDFFDYLSETQADSKVGQDFALAEEVIFKDQAGKLKVLRDGQVFSLDQKPTATTSPDKKPSMTVAPIQKVPTIDFDSQAQEVVKKSNLASADAEQEKRLQSVIKTRLKGARNQVQTRQALALPLEQGGLGLDDQTVDKILYNINQVAEKLDYSSFTPLALKTPASRPADQLETSNRMPEVKFSPQLMGPVEELRSLTLTDFRRLGSTPPEAVGKILSKIKILDQDSFSQRIKGIEGWQKSAVNQLYISLGQQSMIENKPVAQVISTRQASGHPTLTETEFDAIADLNQNLRRYN